MNTEIRSEKKCQAIKLMGWNIYISQINDNNKITLVILLFIILGRPPPEIVIYY